MGSSVVRAHVVVRGRVQMVGFREFVRRRARAASLHGTVRNAPDGTVEAVLEGPELEVKRLIDLVRVGPPAARVERVDVEYQSAAGDLPPITVTI